MKRNPKYVRAKKSGMTDVDLLLIRESAKKTAVQATQETYERAFVHMLGITITLLANDYWSKTAKKRVPKFIEDVVSLFDSVQEGAVTEQELLEIIKEYAGIDIFAEWAEKRCSNG